VPDIIKAVRTVNWAVVNGAADTALESAQALLKESIGDGRQYPSLPERSSSGYNVPVYQYGDVYNSLQIERAPLGPSFPAADFFSDSLVVRYLEDGTSFMEPRPFMTAASYDGEAFLMHAQLTIALGLKV
jgi:hypothetical protein